MRSIFDALVVSDEERLPSVSPIIGIENAPCMVDASGVSDDERLPFLPEAGGIEDTP